MTNRVFSLSLVPVLVVFTGCAHVRFENDDGDRVGFEYYPPKVYLVVQRTEAGPTVNILTLPDLAEPRYVKHKEGWGVTEMSFKVENGVLVEFNQKHDSKGPETLQGAGSLAGGVAGIITAQAAMLTAHTAADQAVIEAVGAAMAGLPKLTVPQTYTIPVLGESVTGIAELARQLQLGREPFTSIAERLQSLSAKLDTLKSVQYADAQALLKAIFERRKLVRETVIPGLLKERAILQKIENNPGEFPAAFGHADRAGDQLDKIIAKLTEFAGLQAAPVEIYEMVRHGTGVRFNRVTLK